MAANNVLTIRQVKEIYRLLDSGVKQTSIAGRYKVRQSLISYYARKENRDRMVWVKVKVPRLRKDEIVSKVQEWVK
jgi:hypothetical protein